MKRMLPIVAGSMLAVCAMGGTAVAKTYTSMTDHGTPGVISSESGKARLVIAPAGDCRQVTYDLVVDGVKSLSGTLDLSVARSMPLDFTTVTLSCTQAGVKAEITLSKSAFEGLGF